MEFTYPKIIQRVGEMTGFSVLYFYGIRPLRAYYTEKGVNEMILAGHHTLENIISIESSMRRIVLTYMSDGSEMILSYIPQLGFFFLFGILGLIFFRAGRKKYISLILFQVITEVLVLLFLWTGLQFTTTGFILSNFLMIYLSPLGCLGFVVWASGARSLSRES